MPNSLAAVQLNCSFEEKGSEKLTPQSGTCNMGGLQVFSWKIPLNKNNFFNIVLEIVKVK